MSMYECEQCGDDMCSMPQVILAVNTVDKIYPYHNTVWDEIVHQLGRRLKERESVWSGFYQWLGMNAITDDTMKNRVKWFCSKECAEEYLKILRFKESG